MKVQDILIKDGITNIKVKQEEATSIVSRLDQLNRWQDELAQDLEELTQQTSQFDTLINNARDKFDRVQVEIENIKEQIIIKKYAKSAGPRIG